MKRYIISLVWTIRNDSGNIQILHQLGATQAKNEDEALGKMIINAQKNDAKGFSLNSYHIREESGSLAV